MDSFFEKKSIETIEFKNQASIYDTFLLVLHLSIVYFKQKIFKIEPLIPIYQRFKIMMAKIGKSIHKDKQF